MVGVGILSYALNFVLLRSYGGGGLGCSCGSVVATENEQFGMLILGGYRHCVNCVRIRS